MEGGDVEFLEDVVIGETDWKDLLDWEPPAPLLGDSSASSSSSSSPLSPNPNIWMGEIENFLMKDDDDAGAKDEEYCENFIADILVNSPGNDSDEAVAAVSTDNDAKAHSEEKDLDNHADDPLSKKRKRQLRNRDAAVKSRERKKMYVKDLEMKSKYLEGECRRLGRLLQCCYAENHALRLGLHMGNAYGASTTKQESAVLLLESLLLGSLLWFLGIMCVFTLPVNHPLLTLNQEWSQQGEEEGKKAPEKVAPRETTTTTTSKNFGYVGVGGQDQSFVKSRRCKASWTKMKRFSNPGCPTTFLIC